MKYTLESARVEKYKGGARAGQRKPITLPKDAIPCGVVSGFGLTLYYLVPVSRDGR